MDLFTVKNGRYKGRGEFLHQLIVGEHAPENSPFYYCPALPHAANLLDPRWFYQDWLMPYASGSAFTVTEVDGGGDNAGQIAVTTDKALLFTTDDADNDLQQLQHVKTFTPAANTVAQCYFRARVSDATQSDVYGGWCATDTSIVASAPADYAMLKKDDGDTIVNGASNDAGGTPSETANLITDFTAAVDYDFGVTLLPSSTTAGTMIFHYKLASATAWSQVVKTTDFPDAAVRFTLLLQNGEAAAKTMTVKRWAFWMFEA